MNNLRLWHKLALLAATLVVPLLALVHLLVSEQNKGIEFALAERRGVAYLRAASRVYAGLQQHQGLAAALLAGDPSAEAKVAAKQAEADAALANLEAVDRKLGGALKTSDKLRSVSLEWQNLKGSLRGMRPEECLTRHNRLLYETHRLIIQMGNASNLVLDPDIDSYYAMDAVVFKLPTLTDLVTQSHAIGHVGLAKGEPWQPYQVTLQSYATRLTDGTRELQENMRYAIEATPRLKTSIAPLLEVSAEKTKDYAAWLEKRLATGAKPTVTTADHATAAVAAFDANQRLYATALDVLDELLSDRIANLQQARLLSLGAVGAILCLALLLTAAFSRALAVRIGRLKEAADKISLGDIDATVVVDGTDEIGDLAERFRRLQVSLKTALDQMEGAP
jgi:methyl-accepting chemotaxis protein